MEKLSQWIISVTAVSIILSVAVSLTPDGNMKKIVRFVGGLILFIVALEPVAGFNPEDIAFYTTQYRADYEKYEEKLIFENSAYVKLIIEDRTRTYIIQQAEYYLIDCDASVTARSVDSGYPFPYSAVITCRAGEENIEKLTRWIEAELAIPRERQSIVIEKEKEL